MLEQSLVRKAWWQQRPSLIAGEERCADLRGADRQPSNANAVLLEHDEAALLERFGELREVRQQQLDGELSAMKGKTA